MLGVVYKIRPCTCPQKKKDCACYYRVIMCYYCIHVLYYVVSFVVLHAGT